MKCASGILATVLAAIALSVAGLAQTGDRLDLATALDQAFKSNPALASSRSGEDRAQAGLSIAKASRMPSASVSETITNGNNPVFAFGSLLEQGRFSQSNFDLSALNNPSPLSNFRLGATLKYSLFDQKQGAFDVAIAKLNISQATASTGFAAQRLRFDVLRAYYDVLLAEARIAASREAIQLAEADVKSTRDRVEAGTTVSSDLLAAEVQLAESQQQLIEAEGEVRTAQAALNLAMGTPISKTWQLEGKLDNRNFILPDQAALLQSAATRRPDLNAAGFSLEALKIRPKSIRNEWLPRVDLFANAGLSRNDFIHGSSDYTIGINLSINLVDAGRKARMSAAAADERIARSNQEALTNQIKFEVVRGVENYKSASQRLAVAERMITAATESLRIVKDRYSAGLTTITEVLRAETTLVRARRNLLSVRRDQYIAFAALLLATGTLDDASQFSR